MTKQPLSLAERIKAWREDDTQGYDTAIGLLCEAETALVEAREAFAAGWNGSWMVSRGWDFEGMGEGIQPEGEEDAWHAWQETRRKKTPLTDSKPTSTD